MSKSLALAFDRSVWHRGRTCGTLRPQGESRCPSCAELMRKPAAPLSLDQPKNWTIDYEPFEARGVVVCGRARTEPRSNLTDRAPRLCLMSGGAFFMRKFLGARRHAFDTR